jgi:hypothetical protein
VIGLVLQSLWWRENATHDKLGLEIYRTVSAPKTNVIIAMVMI